MVSRNGLDVDISVNGYPIHLQNQSLDDKSSIFDIDGDFNSNDNASQFGEDNEGHREPVVAKNMLVNHKSNEVQIQASNSKQQLIESNRTKFSEITIDD